MQIVFTELYRALPSLTIFIIIFSSKYEIIATHAITLSADDYVAPSPHHDDHGDPH